MYCFLIYFVLSCGGQSTTFADFLADVFVHICIGSDVNIICPEPKPLTFIWLYKWNMCVSLWQEERLIFIICYVLDEDATGTVGRKQDNNVFITKFLIIVQIKIIVMILLLVLALLIVFLVIHDICTMMGI